MNNKKINKTVLITGATGGIGKATTELLALNSYDLILLDRSKKALVLLANKISKKYNIKVEYYDCDLSKLEDIEKIQSKIKRFDYLVNIAGKSVTQDKGLVDLQKFDTLIDSNLKSSYLTCMIFGYKSLNNGGAIVNISSIRARTGTDSHSSIYSAAKAGLLGLTKSMALELADKNIRVNAVAPGPTYPTKTSKMWSVELRKNISAKIPLKRLGKPIDVANTIKFLISDDSSYITGQTIDVNGGLWMN